MPFVSPYDKPTRLEALRYYRRVSDAFKLDIVFDEAVVAVSRDAGGARSRRVVRRRHAFGPWRAPVGSRPHGRRRDRRLRRAQSHRRAGRRPAARLALLHAAAPVLQEEGRHRRREELGRRGRARPLSRRRARSRSSTAAQAMGDSIKYWVKPDIDNRIKEGSIPARFETRVVEIRPTSVVVERDGRSRRDRGRRRVPAHRVRRGHDAAAERRDRDRPRDVRPGLRRRNVRDQRARDSTPWERWWPASRAAGSSSRTAASTGRK